MNTIVLINRFAMNIGRKAVATFTSRTYERNVSSLLKSSCLDKMNSATVSQRTIIVSESYRVMFVFIVTLPLHPLLGDLGKI